MQRLAEALDNRSRLNTLLGDVGGSSRGNVRQGTTPSTQGARGVSPFPPTLSARRSSSQFRKSNAPTSESHPSTAPAPLQPKASGSRQNTVGHSGRHDPTTTTARRTQSPQPARGINNLLPSSAHGAGTYTQLRAPSMSRFAQNSGLPQRIEPVDGDASAPCYTVGSMPAAGSLFEAIKDTLLARGDWKYIEPPGLKEIKAAPTPGSQGAANPCCSKLHGVNLFMGEKQIVEKLMAESRIIAMRARRSSATKLMSCSHHHKIPSNIAAPPNANLVNFLEGGRCITVKSRMVKTLLAYFQRKPLTRSVKSLYEYLPVTFILTPMNPKQRLTSSAYVDERDAMIDTMKTINDNDPTGTVSTWIAKCSNGCHGDGIKIVKATTGGLKELLGYIDSFSDGIPWVVCRYVDKPLLYQRRKFDIRVWVLATEDGRIFMHKDLVMRLSSVPYDSTAITTNTKEGILANITNHCVQTTSSTYGAQEAGNELWWDSLSKLLLQTSPVAANKSASSQATGHQQHIDGFQQSLPADEYVLKQMQRIIVESLNAAKENIAAEKGILTNVGGIPTVNGIIPFPSSGSASILTGQQQQQSAGGVGVSSPMSGSNGCESFQMFGYDFLIDSSHRVWLLEINGSPGVADRLMQKLVDDIIEIAIDTKFPPLTVGGHDAMGGSQPRHTKNQKVSADGVRSNHKKNAFEMIYGPEVDMATTYYALKSQAKPSGR